jgi:hypothetical protein
VSLINLLFAESEQALLDSGHGDTVIVISGISINRVFTARFDVTTVISLDGLVGADPREQTIMRVLDPPPTLNRGDVVKVKDSATGAIEKWKIIQREFNPATVTTDFYVERIIPPNLPPIYTPPAGKKFLTDERGVLLTDEKGNLILIDL